MKNPTSVGAAEAMTVGKLLGNTAEQMRYCPELLLKMWLYFVNCCRSNGSKPIANQITTNPAPDILSQVLNKKLHSKPMGKKK